MAVTTGTMPGDSDVEALLAGHGEALEPSPRPLPRRQRRARKLAAIGALLFGAASWAIFGGTGDLARAQRSGVAGIAGLDAADASDPEPSPEPQSLVGPAGVCAGSQITSHCSPDWLCCDDGHCAPPGSMCCGSSTCDGSSTCCTDEGHHWCIASSDTCPTVVTASDADSADANASAAAGAAAAPSGLVECAGSQITSHCSPGWVCCDGHCAPPGRTCCGTISCDDFSTCCTDSVLDVAYHWCIASSDACRPLVAASAAGSGTTGPPAAAAADTNIMDAADADANATGATGAASTSIRSMLLGDPAAASDANATDGPSILFSGSEPVGDDGVCQGWSYNRITSWCAPGDTCCSNGHCAPAGAGCCGMITCAQYPVGGSKCCSVDRLINTDYLCWASGVDCPKDGPSLFD